MAKCGFPKARTSIHTHTFICTHVKGTYVHTRTRAQAHANTNTRTHARTHTHTRTHAHTASHEPVLPTLDIRPRSQ
jgi:hypothetical protein